MRCWSLITVEQPSVSSVVYWGLPLVCQFYAGPLVPGMQGSPGWVWDEAELWHATSHGNLASIISTTNQYRRSSSRDSHPPEQQIKYADMEVCWLLFLLRKTLNGSYMMSGSQSVNFPYKLSCNILGFNESLFIIGPHYHITLSFWIAFSYGSYISVIITNSVLIQQTWKFHSILSPLNVKISAF